VNHEHAIKLYYKIRPMKCVGRTGTTSTLYAFQFRDKRCQRPTNAQSTLLCTSPNDNESNESTNHRLIIRIGGEILFFSKKKVTAVE
jgi:hypothetical protein